jgi:syntaxin 1B/2/3
MAETSKLTNSIRMSIKDLETRAKTARGGDQKTMVTQTEALKKKFRDSISRFQQVEKAYRDRTRQRMERQFRIGSPPTSSFVECVLMEVQPDASQQEIQAAIDDDQGGQIFSQAVILPQPPSFIISLRGGLVVDDIDSSWRGEIGFA